MSQSPYINVPAFARQHNPNARDRIFEQMLEDVGDKEWTESLFLRQPTNAVTTADLIDTTGSIWTMLQPQETKPCKNSSNIHNTSRPSPNRSTHFETED